jgi:hypothetical protein
MIEVIDFYDLPEIPRTLSCLGEDCYWTIKQIILAMVAAVMASSSSATICHILPSNIIGDAE